MATPPCNETPEEHAARLGMLSDLGIERVENLPAEDGEKKGIKYSRAATTAAMCGPAVRAETDSRWLTAINSGEFDDDDADGVKGLSKMAHGRLHAIREPTSSSNLLSSRSSANPSSRGPPARRSSPYDLNHDLTKPLPQFDNSCLNEASHSSDRHQGVPARKKGGPGANAVRATSKGHTKRGGRQSPDGIKPRSSNRQSSAQPVRSSPLKNTSSYQLVPAKPTSAPILGDIHLDERILNLQGGFILYRDVAFLQQAAGTAQLPSTILWITRNAVVQPLFIVVASNAILYEYPLSHWRGSWGSAPERIIKFGDSLGIESIITLGFVNHAAVAAFVEKQDELAAKSQELTVVETNTVKAETKHKLYAPAAATTGSCMSTKERAPTGFKPTLATPAIAPTIGKQAARSSDFSRAEIAAITAGSPDAVVSAIHRVGLGSLLSRRAKAKGKANVSTQPDPNIDALELTAQTLKQNMSHKPAEIPLAASENRNYLIHLDDDTKPAAQRCSKTARSSAILQDMQSLSPTNPTKDGSGVYDDQPQEAAQAHQSALPDQLIKICQDITVKVEQLTRLKFGKSRQTSEVLRQCLYSGLSKSFPGVENPKRGQVISALFLLFEAATRHDGLCYSADEMQDFRSNAEPPLGRTCHALRGLVDDPQMETPARKLEDHRSQVAQVAARRTADIPSLQIESWNQSMGVSTASGVASSSFDTRPKASTSLVQVQADGSEAADSDLQTKSDQRDVVNLETNGDAVADMAVMFDPSLGRKSGHSHSVGSKATQGVIQHVGLASSRWALGSNPANASISATPPCGSPKAHQPIITHAPSVDSITSTAASKCLLFDSRLATHAPKTSSLFDLASLDGGGGQYRMPSVESKRSNADSTHTVNSLFTKLSLHGPASEEYQATEKLPFGRRVRNMNAPATKSGLSKSNIALI